jgi:hypothetical protein
MYLKNVPQCISKMYLNVPQCISKMYLNVPQCTSKMYLNVPQCVSKMNLDVSRKRTSKVNLTFKVHYVVKDALVVTRYYV